MALRFILTQPDFGWAPLFAYQEVFRSKGFAMKVFQWVQGASIVLRLIYRAPPSLFWLALQR